MNHKSKDSEHGGTAVVELNSTLSQLGVFIEFAPARVKSITEVTWKFSPNNVLHDDQFKESDEGDNLVNSSSGDTVCTDGSPSIGV